MNTNRLQHDKECEVDPSISNDNRPSKEKRWLRFYKKENIEYVIPDCSAFDFLVNSNTDNMNGIAISYFGRKITYYELISNINITAQAFESIGICEGDIIPIISVTTPEVVYSLYALNKLGAIPNMIDPRTSVEGILDYCNEIGNVKLIVALSECLEKVKAVAAKLNCVHNIITISPSCSMPFLKSLFYLLLNSNSCKKEKNNILMWQNFLACGEGVMVEEKHFSGDRCFVIVHTGGTTGTPKSVMLSNLNINASAIQCNTSGFTFDKTHSWLSVMPPFIAYGISNGMHLPLCMGMTLIIVPNFNPNTFDKLLIKYKPNHITGVPSHYDSLINSRKLQKADLSYLLSPIVGGDGIDPSFEKKVTTFLRNHNCKPGLIKGYGMTEICAAVSASACVEFNKIGSVGIPFTHSTIAIFDEDNSELELDYNKIGEICMTSPNVMMGYYNNEAETKQILRQHKDGFIWLHSGDLGYMDEDGCVFLVGRKKRLIIRHDGFKVFPTLIEKVVASHFAVKACCVVGENDRSHCQGRNPVVFIQLKKNYNEDVLEEIREKCENELPEYELPVRYEIIESIPLTSIGKVDYKSLENQIN